MHAVSLLYQVTAPHFCAGLIMDGETCVEAAPILGWAVGRRRDALRAYFKRKGWTVRFAGSSVHSKAYAREEGETDRT